MTQVDSLFLPSPMCKSIFTRASYRNAQILKYNRKHTPRIVMSLAFYGPAYCLQTTVYFKSFVRLCAVVRVAELQTCSKPGRTLGEDSHKVLLQTSFHLFK